MKKIKMFSMVLFMTVVSSFAYAVECLHTCVAKTDPSLNTKKCIGSAGGDQACTYTGTDCWGVNTTCWS